MLSTKRLLILGILLVVLAAILKIIKIEQANILLLFGVIVEFLALMIFVYKRRKSTGEIIKE